MELFEYIKSQLPQMPNSAIMKQLGASQELIDYVKETPENTNFAIAEVIGSSGGDIGEVWFVGPIREWQGRKFANLEPTDKADVASLDSAPTDYEIKMNGLSLPEVHEAYEGEIRTVLWADSLSAPTATFLYTKPDEGDEAWDAPLCPNDWTGEVEVSVKAK